MRTALLARTAAAAMFLLMLPEAISADGGKDVVAFRQSVMRLLDGHVNAIMDVVRGRVGFTDHLVAHAVSIEQLSTTLDGLFPATTGPDTLATSALQDVWSDRARFEEATRALQIEASELAAAARSGDQVAIAAEFNSLRRNGCDACHTSFRRRPSQ
ncbi:MAG: cytochrome c [Alphaproteobacteria bacterium]|nr:cytochrome c [Alphaproteobacteria bacterium]